MQEFIDVIYSLVNNYKIKYCPNLPLKDIVFTEDIANKIIEINPDIISNPLFNVEHYKSLAGNVQYLKDETAVILLDISYLCSQYISGEYYWIEVLIHELTHIKDYYENIGIMGYMTLKSMEGCWQLYYWSEFHAKYVGTKHMLNYVNFLPQDNQNAYFNDLKRRIDTFKQNSLSFTNADRIIYEWMHIMGEILAWEESKNVCIEFNSEQDLRPLLKTYTEEIDAVKLLHLGRVIEGAFK